MTTKSRCSFGSRTPARPRGPPGSKVEVRFGRAIRAAVPGATYRAVGRNGDFASAPRWHVRDRHRNYQDFHVNGSFSVLKLGTSRKSASVLLVLPLFHVKHLFPMSSLAGTKCFTWNVSLSLCRSNPYVSESAGYRIAGIGGDEARPKEVP